MAFVVARAYFADLTSIVEDLMSAPNDNQDGIADDVGFEAVRRLELWIIRCEASEFPKWTSSPAMLPLLRREVGARLNDMPDLDARVDAAFCLVDSENIELLRRHELRPLVSSL